MSDRETLQPGEAIIYGDGHMRRVLAEEDFYPNGLVREFFPQETFAGSNWGYVAGEYKRFGYYWHRESK